MVTVIFPTFPNHIAVPSLTASKAALNLTDNAIERGLDRRLVSVIGWSKCSPFMVQSPS